ncbi:type VI secretion system ImpA family N-terminal domain-containing protein [Pseudoalteromonas sp. MMG005]|uniref:type VI secretion system ImpA family N-terminal domain-containing protein n=1 Tax=Pseudoalteromonas sp. MMG005 TaxID=2822682 RepID=UPI001B39F716|nr:type VI secretion system ImpA family N-terminal domain-containing protein [Pseudoalteromonas sp. MMG005]MBQ4844183.1 type VI secretion system ImpA family N-terminal domain-containing protein [Pseudoalteromonas sp. MMG005]
MLLFTQDSELDVGIYLKEQRAKFRELRNLLNVAQSSLRKLLETPTSAQDQDLQRQNAQAWYQLQQVCGETLKNDSRDIEVFVWWLAALPYKKADLSLLDEGLSDFLYALNTLKESIHPRLPDKKVAGLDEEQARQKQCENQTRPLEQLTGDGPNTGLLNAPLMNFPLIENYTFSDYLSDHKAGKLEKQKAEFAGVIQSHKAQLMAQFATIISIDSKIGEIDLFINGYRNKNGLALLGFRFVKDNLKQIKVMYQYFFPDVDKKEEVAPAIVEPVQTSDSNDMIKPDVIKESTQTERSVVLPQAQSDKSTYTREDALADLNQIAVFFKQTEPHSPIPYLLARAIRWGNMSFSELMGELITKDSPVLAEISKLTGVENDLGELLNEQVVVAPVPKSKPVEPIVTEEISTPAEPEKVEQVSEQQPKASSSSSGPLW